MKSPIRLSHCRFATSVLGWSVALALGSQAPAFAQNSSQNSQSNKSTQQCSQLSVSYYGIPIPQGLVNDEVDLGHATGAVPSSICGSNSSNQNQPSNSPNSHQAYPANGSHQAYPAHGDHQAYPAYGTGNGRASTPPPYHGEQPVYGNAPPPQYHNVQPAYGNAPPPQYHNVQPAYGNAPPPQYHTAHPAYGVAASPQYHTAQPAYGSPSPPQYHTAQPVYGVAASPQYNTAQPVHQALPLVAPAADQHRAYPGGQPQFAQTANGSPTPQQSGQHTAIPAIHGRHPVRVSAVSRPRPAYAQSQPQLSTTNDGTSQTQSGDHGSHQRGHQGNGRRRRNQHDNHEYAQANQANRQGSQHGRNHGNQHGGYVATSGTHGSGHAGGGTQGNHHPSPQGGRPTQSAQGQVASQVGTTPSQSMDPGYARAPAPGPIHPKPGEFPPQRSNLNGIAGNSTPNGTAHSIDPGYGRAPAPNANLPTLKPGELPPQRSNLNGIASNPTPARPANTSPRQLPPGVKPQDLRRIAQNSVRPASGRGTTHAVVAQPSLQSGRYRTHPGLTPIANAKLAVSRPVDPTPGNRQSTANTTARPLVAAISSERRSRYEVKPQRVGVPVLAAPTKPAHGPGIAVQNGNGRHVYASAATRPMAAADQRGRYPAVSAAYTRPRSSSSPAQQPDGNPAPNIAAYRKTPVQMRGPAPKPVKQQTAKPTPGAGQINPCAMDVKLC